MEKTIKQRLLSLRLTGLMELAFRLKASPPSSTRRKADWAESILEKIDDPELLCSCMGYTAMRLTRRMVRRSAKHGTPGVLKPQDAGEEDAVRQLRQLALVNRVDGGWACDPLVRRMAAQTLGSQLRYEEDLYSCVTAWLWCYGVMDLKPLTALVQKCGLMADEEMILWTVLSRAGLRMISYAQNRVWIKCPAIDGPTLSLLTLLMQSETRPDWPPDWTQADSETLRQAEDDLFTCHTTYPALGALQDELARHGIPFDDCPALICRVVEAMQHGAEDAAMMDIAQELVFMDDSTLRRLQNMLADIPLWRLMGRSLRESRALSQHPVAFHEACPCGSGLPWGSCHGRYQ